jgi:hypothetical protein
MRRLIAASRSLVIWTVRASFTNSAPNSPLCSQARRASSISQSSRFSSESAFARAATTSPSPLAPRAGSGPVAKSVPATQTKHEQYISVDVYSGPLI